MAPLKLIIILIFIVLIFGCNPEKQTPGKIENDKEEMKKEFNTQELVDSWASVWNSNDLSLVERLFLTDSYVTYFSTEKEGLIRGINAIRKQTPIPELDYAQHLWHERQIQSVANVTRRDALEFLPLAEQIGIQPHVQTYAFDELNQALLDLKQSKVQGAAVLKID